MLSLLLSSLVTIQRFEVQELPIRGHLRGPYENGAMLVYGEREVLVLNRDLTIKERIKDGAGLPVLRDGKVRFAYGQLSNYSFNPPLRHLRLDDYGLPWYGWTEEMKLVFVDTDKEETYDEPSLDTPLPLGRREPGYFFHYSRKGLMMRSSKTSPLEESLELKDVEGNNIWVIWSDGCGVIDSRRIAFIGRASASKSKASSVPTIVLPEYRRPGVPEKEHVDPQDTIYVADFDTRRVTPLVSVAYVDVWDKSEHPSGLSTRLRYRPAERDLVFVVDKYIFRVPVR